MKKKVVGILVGFVILALLAGGAALVYSHTRPDTQEGGKTVTVQVVYDEVDTSFTLHTDATFLRGALEEKQLISGEESSYGLFVKTVNGRTADDNKQEWWCFTKGGETIMEGVDAIAIADGDGYEITLKTGW